ncbi:TlpA family protein disulfide reductase [Taibaiella lutea]|uniref:TlpA family protein disulfide reductase n=1 Tax=Taibaiella lutea TaxID=2608001 RepID=A0A5M6CC61_9BACT|nr:TlpA disulfide reductase family protein [Taibaiella lutea]KAA5532583.1 TlpA family protein disulfide reductase [Taibaiella lutea]
MKKLCFLVFVFSLLAAGSSRAQNIASYAADDLNKRTSGKDTIYIVNFWATWCIPCVKELPAFNKVQEAYKDRPVKVILVSFDFKEQYPDKLSAWVRKKQLKPEVAWFNETNPTLYIPKLAPEWEGGLPATILINNTTGERLVKAKEITFEELKTWIDKQL